VVVRDQQRRDRMRVDPLSGQSFLHLHTTDARINEEPNSICLDVDTVAIAP
jgi:hypothetical protein